MENRYETKLSPEQESKFQLWLDSQYRAGKIGAGDYRFYKQNGYGYDYDFRAAFAKGLAAADNGHWGDIGKKPNHPTFSDQSKYASAPGANPGKWIGEIFVPNTRSTSNPLLSMALLGGGLSQPNNNLVALLLQKK
jgi:hypothetical protein